MAYEKLRYDRVLSGHRQGNGAKIQMFGGQTGSPLSDPAENDIAIYDANGNVVSSGQSIADISSGSISVAKAGTLIGTRGRLNLIEGSNVTLTVADDAGNDEIDCTIASSGGTGGGSVTLGARADLPASPGEAGEQYYCTDAAYHYVAGGSPLGWQAYFSGFPVTEPADADFGTWVDQGSATTSEAHGGVRLTVPAQGSGNWRIKVKSIPSAPYKVTALLICGGKPQSYWQGGLILRQSSDGKFVSCSQVYESAINNQKFNSTTSFAGTYTNYPSASMGGMIWLQIEDDNTNRITRVSFMDYDFGEMVSVTRTDFITPDQIGFGMDLNNNSAGYLHLISWKEE